MAAQTMNIVEPGFIEREGVGAGDLDKTLDMFRARFNQTVLKCTKYFRTERTSGGTYKEQDFSPSLTLPPKNEDSDDLPFVTSLSGWPKTIVAYEFRHGIQTTRAMVEDQIHGQIKKMMSGLLDSGRLLYEHACADILNNLTATIDTGYDGSDGVPAAYDAHPNPVNAGTTWDNLSTGATLTHGSFSTARTEMRKRTSDRGYVMDLLPRLLTVPVDLEQTAKEIKRSEKVPDDSLNHVNVWKDDPWEVDVNNYLTDTNAWMLWANIPKEYRNLIIAVAAPLSVGPLGTGDVKTDMIWGKRLRTRFGVGFSHLRDLQYNNGPS